MRRYWSGEGSLIGEVSGRMTGSSDLFNHDGRRPRASVNHITVHDGFTLADLFSYNEKHNEANGEDNRDGSNDNHSNNCGHEGPTDDPAIIGAAPPAAQEPARLPVAGAGPAADSGRRRGRQHAERQQQRLLPGQRNRLGRLGRPRPRRRRPHRFHRPHDRDAPALSANPLAPLARRPARRRILRRVVADAGRRRHEGSRTGIFRKAGFSPTCSARSNQGSAPLFIVLNAAPEEIAFTLPKMPEYKSWQQLLNTADVKQDGRGLRVGQARPRRLRARSWPLRVRHE